VHPPIAPARDKGQNGLSGKESLAVTINEGEDGAAGIIGPGGPGYNDQVIGLKTDGINGLDRISFAQKGLQHHTDGGKDCADGKSEVGKRAKLFPMDIHLAVSKPVNEPTQKISGLTAERIGEDKDAFIFQGRIKNELTVYGLMRQGTLRKELLLAVCRHSTSHTTGFVGGVVALSRVAGSGFVGARLLSRCHPE
jgi:hypothetical protein